jgi:hypothetical protein
MLPISDSSNEQHVYHHSEGAKINVSIEKNSRGFNYSATVTNASNVAEGIALLNEAVTELKKKYGQEDTIAFTGPKQ